MEEAPATQYIFSLDNPIYHLARNDRMTLCGLWLSTNLEHRKRKDDRRLSPEKPTRQFTMLCSECDRKVTGATEPEPQSLELLSPHGFMSIP